ncbi:hypothetical protein GCM10010411_76580 [Actinomadura fulvescens]|uniref:Uncharacterized protein n=1 Tax=Actinomadura fulvescens TaxID=46160 RepID=A0ABN3QJG0_9ACTN
MIATLFTPDEIECLVRTAAETVGTASADDFPDLSTRQFHLSGRAYQHLEAECEGRSQTSPSTALASGPNRRVWLLWRWSRWDGESVEAYADESAAVADLASEARQNWDVIAGNDGIPDTAPEADDLAIAHYFGPPGEGDTRGYRLLLADVQTSPKTRLLPEPRTFPTGEDCARAIAAPWPWR